MRLAHAFETGSEARSGIGRWIGCYNAARPHSSFDGRTPDEVYAIDIEQEKIGGVTKPGIHLSQAAKLSQKADPPLFDVLAGVPSALTMPISGRSPTKKWLRFSRAFPSSQWLRGRPRRK